MPSNVRPILYVAPGSSSSLASIQMLSAAKVDYLQHDISREPLARSRLIARTGRADVPTLVWGRDVLANFRDWELTRFVRAHRG